jgi:integrase
MNRGGLLLVHVTPRKTEHSIGKRQIIEWSTELRKAIATAKAARPVDITPWLFCTRKGECYIDEEKGTASGWDSMWQRFMERVLKETKVTERFTEHDLRAKCASDAETLEHARALLLHADSQLTQRVYRRRPERVKPGAFKL